MATLAQETRLEIIRELAQEPADVTTLADALELDISSISHHLRLLRDCGMVAVSAIRQRHIYRLGGRISASIRKDVLHLSAATTNGDRLILQACLGRSRSSADKAAG